MIPITVEDSTPAKPSLFGWIGARFSRPARASREVPMQHSPADPFCFDAPPHLSGTFDDCVARAR